MKMKSWTITEYKLIALLVEISFGLLLLFNGLILLINYFDLIVFKEKFQFLSSLDLLLHRSIQEWRTFLGFIQTIFVNHIAGIVLVCIGFLIVKVDISRKRSRPMKQ
ncbi:hypothetical protein [Polynucleobacter paneuropaeus]|jgi:hypothetical protein|uniref:hypothetical protein n=2 Tax=Polynucleobacter paneuropaeus TaxID=2527775 RepID=UPI001BFDF575|nr:hypothetical protein [Polynucleobacter paneuropaeus]MBT8525065.1 hypothetical protein [Polynucleobacter paneuropaeus]MBT8527523.1 hypothetical protein [Polynucleobacter paneuropaeus]MBT8534186.1 hypothetical protein [Polynucleobacter paneuropaeus]MBT8544075.1 hypothetical protein [Polynucleobacter paneuropaeus]MBT8561227.1 hypothetical protein [Polynucleobacter paneuropaeus]